MPSGNSYSFEQTIVLRAALDMALAATGDLANERRRREVASILLRFVGDDVEFDAPTLAQLALDKERAVLDPKRTRAFRNEAAKCRRTAQLARDPVLWRHIARQWEFLAVTSEKTPPPIFSHQPAAPSRTAGSLLASSSPAADRTPPGMNPCLETSDASGNWRSGIGAGRSGAHRCAWS